MLPAFALGYARDMPCGRDLAVGASIMEEPAFGSPRIAAAFADRPCGGGYVAGERLTVQVSMFGAAVPGELVTGNEWVIEVSGATLISGIPSVGSTSTVWPRCEGRRIDNVVTLFELRA